MNAQAQDPMSPLSPPNVASYREFRMAAEWASAIRGKPVGFDYDDLTGRITAAPSGEPAPLLTLPGARRPVVESVEFGVEGADHPITLGGDEYSALLWSESAVEKFLFPYFASVAADDAEGFLDRLSRAWYGYPGRVVQVCALALGYGAAAEGRELSLDDAVQLVCLERARRTLRVMSLGDFEGTYPSGAAQGTRVLELVEPKAVELKGWEVGPTIDSIVVREAAEFVSGLRGHFVWFTLDDGKLTPWVCATEDPGALPYGTVVTGGVTTAVRSDRPAPDRVTLHVAPAPIEPVIVDKPVIAPGDDATTSPDALFWTDGAVETLLLPYYASVKGRHAPFFTSLLMGKWNGLVYPGSHDEDCAVRALQRLLPSRLAARASEGLDEEHASSVFAVTHLPRSEYVGETETSGAALEQRTRMLALDRSEVVDHPLFGASTPRPAS